MSLTFRTEEDSVAVWMEAVLPDLRAEERSNTPYLPVQVEPAGSLL